MENKDYLSILTVLSPLHTLARVTVDSFHRFCDPLRIPWVVSVGPRVDWLNDTIGHRRLEALDGVHTEYVMCLDSDDAFLASLPIEDMKKHDVDFFVFNCVRGDTTERTFLSKAASTNSGVHRVAYKTEFLKKILNEFVETKIIREDVFMMWKAFAYGEFKYFPFFIHRKYGNRCNSDPLFKRLNQTEKKSFWPTIFDEKFLKIHNERMLRNTIK